MMQIVLRSINCITILLLPCNQELQRSAGFFSIQQFRVQKIQFELVHELLAQTFVVYMILWGLVTVISVENELFSVLKVNPVNSLWKVQITTMILGPRLLSLLGSCITRPVSKHLLDTFSQCLFECFILEKPEIPFLKILAFSKTPVPLPRKPDKSGQEVLAKSANF